MDGLIIPRIDDFSALADADAQRVRTTVLDGLATDSARFLSECSERFGNVLNADDAATLFDEYNADRARYRVAVHPAATWVRDELFCRCLAVAPADDAYIVFTAGCNAAGKTTVIRSSRVFDQIIHSHRGAAETLRALWDDYAGDYRIACRFVVNTAQGVRPGSLELTEPRDYTEIRAKLHELLRAEYRAGRITENVYDRVRGTGE